jgi:LDH2 family malate/lactate/ureidoglycolate dehydrogenase
MDRWDTLNPRARAWATGLTPGLEEVEAEAQRRELGIPLHTEVVDWFKAACQEFEIPFRLR